jgi:hypothetical protein
MALYILDDHVRDLYIVVCLLTLDLVTTLDSLGDRAEELYIVAYLLALDLVKHYLISGRRLLISRSLWQYPLEYPEIVQSCSYSV